jgi:hypothetical protein
LRRRVILLYRWSGVLSVRRSSIRPSVTLDRVST